MIFKNMILKYSRILLVFLAFGCEPLDDCSVNSIETSVQGKKVSVNISATSSGELVQYNWHFSDGFSKATTTPFVEHTLSQNGSYIVQVEVEQSYGDYCYYESGFVIKDESLIEDTCGIEMTEFIHTGNYIQAKVEIEGVKTDAQYTWESGDGFQEVSNTSDFVYEYTQPGYYQFKVTYTKDACKYSLKKEVFIP